MAHDLAPEGTVFWCVQCGRISADREGKNAITPGWTDDCAKLAMLIHTENWVQREDGRVLEADIVSPQSLPPEIECKLAEANHPKEI